MSQVDSIIIQTPLGFMIAKADESGIASLDFTDSCDGAKDSDNPHLKQLKVELGEYFDGKRQEFGVKLSPKGTPFHMSVWETLQKIPYGETVSYAKEAQDLGHPKAVRAVANANGRNPIAILIPCHRVIASSGKIGGYSGGVEKKEFLLNLEKSRKMSISEKNSPCTTAIFVSK